MEYPRKSPPEITTVEVAGEPIRLFRRPVEWPATDHRSATMPGIYVTNHFPPRIYALGKQPPFQYEKEDIDTYPVSPGDPQMDDQMFLHAMAACVENRGYPPVFKNAADSRLGPDKARALAAAARWVDFGRLEPPTTSKKSKRETSGLIRDLDTSFELSIERLFTSS